LAETSPHCVAGPLVEYLRTGYRQKTFELFEEIGLHGSLCRRDAASGDLEVALPHSRLMAQMPVADAVHTVLSLVRGQFAPEAAAALRQVDLSERIPLEAPSLAMPQSAFFSKPYWGHPTRGVSLREGKAPVPIRLQTPDDTLEDKPLEDALAVGTKSTLTYLVPQGIYDRLEVWAGLHAELGVAGDVVFEVKGSDEKTLAKTQVLGSQPARRLSVPLAGQSSIQLITTAGSTDSTSNYAVWGRPRLVRSERETSVRVR
jgi:hypothetical protein